MDPLAVLRGFVIDKNLDQVVESPDGSRIQFGDRYSFPKVCPDLQFDTCWESYKELVSYKSFFTSLEIMQSRLIHGMLQDVATAYKSQMGRGDLYPLSSLVFFMKNARKGGDLIKLANQAGVKPVTFIDRKVRLLFQANQFNRRNPWEFPRVW